MNTSLSIAKDDLALDARPRIAVVCDDPSSASAQHAIAKLEKASVRPMVMSIPDEDAPIEEVAKSLRAIQKLCDTELDGVLLMGSNGDIDPADYGEKRAAHTVDPANRNRKAVEELLVKWAKKEDKPLLGICAGMQRIAVMHGAKLNQHVEGEWQDVEQVPYHETTEEVTICPDSRLGKLAGMCCMKVEIPQHARSILGVAGLREMDAQGFSSGINSMHHQAVDAGSLAGTGLRVAATSPTHCGKGVIVEAIESTDPERKSMLMGLQWHPEFLECGLSAQLFGHLAEQARSQHTVRERSQVEAGERASITQGGAWVDFVQQQPASGRTYTG